MLRLIIMRHGEAASAIGFDDKKRHLTDRGHAQSRAAGEQIRSVGWQPDAAFVSSATRTRETYADLQTVLGDGITTQFIDRFYLGTARDVVAELAEATEKTILIVGHNPGWSDMASELVGERIGLSPADAALVSSSESDWPSALHLAGTWSLEHLWQG